MVHGCVPEPACSLPSSTHSLETAICMLQAAPPYATVGQRRPYDRLVLQEDEVSSRWKTAIPSPCVPSHSVGPTRRSTAH